MERKSSTIEGYLIEYIQDSKITDPSPWVEPAVAKRVYQAHATVGGDRLKPIRDHLNEEVSYSHIRICLACRRNCEDSA